MSEILILCGPHFLLRVTFSSSIRIAAGGGENFYSSQFCPWMEQHWSRVWTVTKDPRVQIWQRIAFELGGDNTAPVTHCFSRNHSAFSPFFCTKTPTDLYLSPVHRQSVHYGPIMTHCPEIVGHRWLGLIVSDPCLLGWTESHSIYIRLIPAAAFCLDTGDKRAMCALILRPKTDWSHSTQIPAEERHYYLLFGSAVAHFKEALWRAN